MKPNSYSREWFEFFHVGIDERRTKQETKFISSCAPLPDFGKVLDVCCGMGRHARALSKLGYSVIGIDRDADMIAQARELGGGPNYIVADVRDYVPEPGAFDVAMVMSQSFGYFDAGENRDVLARLARGLRQGGRIFLDLWNLEFFTTHQGERELKTEHGIVREAKRMEGDRLFVELEYPGGTRERFEWQLFDAGQMEKLAVSVGLFLLVSCSNFEERNVCSPAEPRMQFVLERRSR